MAQSFFKLSKTWYNGEWWVIPGDFHTMYIRDSEIFRIYDGGDYVIAAIRNYPFYLHGQNPACFSGFLRSQI